MKFLIVDDDKSIVEADVPQHAKAFPPVAQYLLLQLEAYLAHRHSEHPAWNKIEG